MLPSVGLSSSVPYKRDTQQVKVSDLITKLTSDTVTYTYYSVLPFNKLVIYYNHSDMLIYIYRMFSFMTPFPSFNKRVILIYEYFIRIFISICITNIDLGPNCSCPFYDRVFCVFMIMTITVRYY